MSIPVRATHPISFSLLNDDDQPVMDIVDGAEGRDMKLLITNSSRRDMKLAGETSAVEATRGKHRFELSFRPGTLNPAAKIAVDAGDGGWLISNPDQTNGTVSLYLLNKNEVSLAAGASLSLTLRHVSADGRGGARGTRVELKYSGLQYVSGQGSEALADGYREQYLSIVNQRGQKHIPLHVGIVGSNTILNDGHTANDRIIKITNTLKENKLPLSTVPLSRFILSFDVYDPNEKNDWALGTSSLVQAIEVEAVQDSILTTEQVRARLSRELRSLSQGLSPAHKQKLAEKTSDSERVDYLLNLHTRKELKVSDNWIVWKNVQGATVAWTIMPTQDKTFLDKDESVRFRLNTIVSDMRSGPANVYLRYENIPGYWDGQFVTTLEKSNLVQRDQLKADESYTQSSFIGIGRNSPIAKLDVAGTTRSTRLISIGENVSTHEQGAHLEWNIDNGGGRTYLLNQKGLGPGGIVFGEVDTAANVIERMRINEQGNVGIGTDAPGSSKLKIADSATDFAHFRFAEKGAGEFEVAAWSGGWNINTKTTGKSLYLNRDTSSDVIIGSFSKELIVKGDSGKVGIGGVTPEAKLHIIHQNEDAGSGTLILGPTNNKSNLRLGYNEGYSWIQSHGNKPLAINPIGNNVGIGTYDPNAKLHVAGSAVFDGNVGLGTNTVPGSHLEISNPQGNWIFLRQQRSSQAGGFHIHNPWGEGNSEDRNRLEIAYRTAAGEDKWGQFVIHGPSGRVGIGKSDPTAPLHVGFSQRANHWIQDQYAFLAYRWEEHHDNWVQTALSGRGQPQYFDDASVLAEGRVVASEFNSFSDSRIKERVNTSESSDDLSLLRQLRVTDYQFKDFLSHGDRHGKGFIADEVEQLFPQAVSKRSDFIPDIYTPARETTLNGEVLTVSLKDEHNLAEGDRVRLVTESGVREVSVTVVDEKSFAVSNWQGGAEKLFVYGRKVDDFRTLDYQQIFSLGISGIQQLAKEVDELRASNDALTERLRLLESKMAAAPSIAGAKNGSNGNGKH